LKLPIIGVHLRLEGDWDVQDCHILYRLDQYAEEIDKIVSSLDSSFAIYLASANLKPKFGREVRMFFSKYNVPILRKSNFLTSRDIDALNMDAKGIVDAEVLFAVDHFVGCAPSSLSYIVQERRLSRGYPSRLTRKPGFWLWFPIFVPPTNDWRFRRDPEPVCKAVTPFPRLH
jgi:hypothetical protein